LSSSCIDQLFRHDCLPTGPARSVSPRPRTSSAHAYIIVPASEPEDAARGSSEAGRGAVTVATVHTTPEDAASVRVMMMTRCGPKKFPGGGRARGSRERPATAPRRAPLAAAATGTSAGGRSFRAASILVRPGPQTPLQCPWAPRRRPDRDSRRASHGARRRPRTLRLTRVLARRCRSCNLTSKLRFSASFF
jgi:hypothetical protein